MSFFGRMLGRQPRFVPTGPVQPPALSLQERFVPAGEVFTPTKPKTGRRRLIGRLAELERILQLLQQDKAHVVLYSERGRGKTSLSNLAVEAMRRNGVIVARHICDAGSTFDSIMRGLMRDLPHSLLAASASAEGEGCEAALPAGELRPRDIVALPSRLAARSLVCVVDEFDRVEDMLTRTRLADTIKQLSDRDSPMLFLIVGVSENLDQILGQHPSIQRSLGGVHLPLFTDREIAQIIAKGGRESGFSFPPSSIARITVLSRGMPYMAQLLGLRLTQAAAARNDTAINEEDFETAVVRMADDAPQRVKTLYSTLTNHGADAEMMLALRRIATAPQDPWGRLRVVEAEDGVVVGGRHISADCWRELRAAEILQPGPPASGLYTFAERGLMHHVLLLAARDAVLPDVPIASEPRAAAEVRGLHPALSQG